jgi:hypothetical protein
MFRIYEDNKLLFETNSVSQLMEYMARSVEKEIKYVEFRSVDVE